VKIVIAAWHVRDMNVGLGRYTKNLVEAIGKVDQENDYEILLPHRPSTFLEYPNVKCRVVRFPIFKRRFWEQVATVMVDRYDLLHFPYDSCVAAKRGKFVATIHDVKPLIFPNLNRRYNWKEVLRKTISPRPYEIIDHIVTVSECSKRDIVEKLGVSESKVSVVYQGVELGRYCPQVQSSHQPEVGGSYILCVAGNDPTKNVKTLIQAFGMLPDNLRNSHKLVLVGDVQRQRDVHQMIRQMKIEKQIVLCGVVSEERLISFYQNAKLFVFPSLYEGFGLPVLESMACGCPVVSSRSSSLPEVIGDAGILVDPLNPSEMSQAMEGILINSELWAQLRQVGLNRAKQFDWRQTALKTVEVYKKVYNA
jgi:glycosyltransferase involved in cell wall biosynthesis